MCWCSERWRHSGGDIPWPNDRPAEEVARIRRKLARIEAKPPTHPNYPDYADRLKSTLRRELAAWIAKL